MKLPRESNLIRATMEFLRFYGLFAWRNNSGSFGGEYKGKRHYVRFGLRGAPDIMAIGSGGRFIGIECKRKDGKQSLTQHAWQFECETHGGLYILARNLDDVCNGLKKAGLI